MTRIAELLHAGTTISYEFFPPRTDAGWLTLGKTIADLEQLQPSFVSVTYGAGGGTRQRTHDIVSWIGKETSIVPMAHLTCNGHVHAEIATILDNYRDAGVENILALGGDPRVEPGQDPPSSDYTYALELVEEIADRDEFCVGVAAHPEVHPRSADRAADRRRLADKLRRADFAITQFFFDPEHWIRLVDELSALGVDKPVIPGIMPITNLAQVQRMAELSGAEVPGWLVERLGAGGDDPAEVARIGVEAATELCAELLHAGAPGLHFYTLNRSKATREIAAALGVHTS